MDLVSFDLSHNIYYADQLGSVSEQIDFLDQLHISEPVLCISSSFDEILMFTATYVLGPHLFSRLCVLKPSEEKHIRTFNHHNVIDIRRYLCDRGFHSAIQEVHFKKLDYEKT